MSNNNVLSKVRSLYNQFTRLEKKVADYVLDHSQQVIKMTISELAEESGVGDTTVFRFCRSLEMSGYQDFKLALALSSDMNEILDTNENISITDSHDMEELALNVSLVINSTVSETMAALDYSAVSKTVDLLLSSDNVYLYGFGSSGITALLMQNRLMRVIPNVFFSIDVHMQLTSAALLKPNTAAIIFCNSGVTKDSIRIAQMAHQAGATTVFITKLLTTPASPYVDILLPCGATEGPMQGGSIAVLAAQQYIVSLIYSELLRKIGDKGKLRKIKAAQAIAERKL